MNKLLPILCLLIIASCSQEPLSLKDGTSYSITCTPSDPNSKEKYMTRMRNGAAGYRSGRSKYCSSQCEEFAKERDAIVEACKIVPYVSIRSFSFEIDGLEGSKELGASFWDYDSCGKFIEDREVTMTYTPSVITFKIPYLKASTKYYDVDRKTLQGGFRYAGSYHDTCTIF